MIRSTLIAAVYLTPGASVKRALTTAWSSFSFCKTTRFASRSAEGWKLRSPTRSAKTSFSRCSRASGQATSRGRHHLRGHRHQDPQNAAAHPASCSLIDRDEAARDAVRSRLDHLFPVLSRGPPADPEGGGNKSKIASAPYTPVRQAPTVAVKANPGWLRNHSFTPQVRLVLRCGTHESHQSIPPVPRAKR